MRKWALVLFPFWVVVLCCLNLIQANGKRQVPCFFIFGDSLVDNGNNNLLSSVAKVNYAPYGIDFPQGPTGRFGNGLTTVDILAELLGFKNYIPPFATAMGKDILSGVNYASGSAGILNETGQHLGAHISMDGQLKNHQITVSRIIKMFGSNHTAAGKYLEKCLYSVGMGSNDYINNFFQPKHYQTSRRYTPEQYAKVLAVQYFKQLKTLHSYGARRVALLGIGPIGCAPNSISLYGANGGSTKCAGTLNNAAELFNKELRSLIRRLNKSKREANFIFLDAMGFAFNTATSGGFKVLDAGCCQVGSSGQCIPSKTPCQNRTEYAFWDAFHPTEAANRITARLTYNALFQSNFSKGVKDVSPQAEL